MKAVAGIAIRRLVDDIPQSETRRRETVSDACRVITRIAGRELSTFDLRPGVMDELRIWLENSSLKHLRFKQFCLLWKEARELGYVDFPPPRFITDGLTRVTRFRQVKPISEVTGAELPRLLEAAGAQFQRFCYFRNGVSKLDYWECCLRVAVETRLPRSELLCLEFSDVDFVNGACRIMNGADVALSRGAIESIRAIQRPRRKLILEPAGTSITWRKQYRKIAMAAGVMRRSIKSYCAHARA